MNELEYSKMVEFKDYWWHIGKRYLIETLLKDMQKDSESNFQVLEIGSGSGEVTEVLVKYGNVTGMDVSKYSVKICNDRGFPNIIEADAETFDFSSLKSKFDLVVLSDVLEHLDDDVNVLKKLGTVLKKGGNILITVPAHKFLWSEHDEALNHRRRYHRKELVKKLDAAGMIPTKLSFFVSTAFIPISIFRIINNFIGSGTYPKTSYIKLPRSINSLMAHVLKLEVLILKRISIPIGVTLVTIAKPVQAEESYKESVEVSSNTTATSSL